MYRQISIENLLSAKKLPNSFSKIKELYGDTYSIEDACAYITHYIHNSGIKLSYKELAKQFIDILYKSEVEKDVNCVCEESPQYNLFPDIKRPQFLPKDKADFTFIDLFAGIGGIRLGFQNNGGRCVFSSEWEPNAKRTYFKNFGEVPFGDITKDSTKNAIPESFDILCGGFPCQAFSIAGYRKGFEDTRGTLFFDIATILERHKPKAFLLENVKNLQSHNEGRTFKTIISTLEEIGYKVFYQVMNTMEYANIPQNRERIFIVGFLPCKVANWSKFEFPKKKTLDKVIQDCIDYSENDETLFYRENQRYYPLLIESMKSKDSMYQWRRQYVRENKSNVCPTLTANMGTGGHNVPLILTDKGIRKLTPKECLNFQGFPENYCFPNIAKSKCYQQAGNSVTVPLIEKIAKQIKLVL